MRQTLWAEQIIIHKEGEKIKADDYFHVHIIPNENDELLYKDYKTSNKPLRETWLDNLNDKEKYIIISPMDFLKNIDNNKYNELFNYLQNRYWNGKSDYIFNRYCKNEIQKNTEYIMNCFEEFDNLSCFGMDYGELCGKLNESCQYSGPQGLFAPEVLANEKEIVCIVDYAFLRNATAYVIFYDKKTEKIILVMDNLNTHTLASLYAAFEPVTARQLHERFEVHHTPKHGSWLNMAELEIGIMSRQCLDQRISTFEKMVSKVQAWAAQRNSQKSAVRWQFTTADARIKLQHLYPQI
jgi:hypothetical protein